MANLTDLELCDHDQKWVDCYGRLLAELSVRGVEDTIGYLAAGSSAADTGPRTEPATAGPPSDMDDALAELLADIAADPPPGALRCVVSCPDHAPLEPIACTRPTWWHGEPDCD
jgi:hypothetical protein